MALQQDVSFVIIGDLNANPFDGEGSHRVIRELLVHPLVQDVTPFSRGAVLAAAAQGGGNKTQIGDPALDTVDWHESRTPGNMRVDYVLPSADLTVTGAGVFWPAPDEVGFAFVGSNGDLGSHHRLVWVDIE
ncbi:MAG: endonuclease/exonuclease/phosphatase family protein [Paracoccaceae bacterium]|jgi:hypothetical protein